MEEPKNQSLEKLIPEGTKLNGVEFKAGTAIIDFSGEFIENMTEDVEEQSKIIYSIVNTLTELTEVNAVKILINGEEGKELKGGALRVKR